MGTQEMTPIARWTRFNADATQASGNGWFQHSIGSWDLNGNKLSIENSNGIVDNSEPFQVFLEDEKMIWKRKEGADSVRVILKKIDKLPMSEGNKLLGLWKHIESSQKNIDSVKMFHFRWDNVYVKYGTKNKREFGVFKIHGHKPEIQMVNYGESNSFNFWKFEISKDTLIMTATDKSREIRFKKSHQFPQ